MTQTNSLTNKLRSWSDKGYKLSDDTVESVVVAIVKFPD